MSAAPHQPVDIIEAIETVCAILSEYILADKYEPEDWRRTSAVAALKRLATVMRVAGHDVPDQMTELLRRAEAATERAGDDPSPDSST
jgi:hypothetical protein